MDEYIKEVGNSLEIDFLSDVGNGIFLSNREREVLDRYNIDYKNKSSLKSILLEIEDILNEEEIEELDLISESIAERVYYNYTNK